MAVTGRGIPPNLLEVRVSLYSPGPQASVMVLPTVDTSSPNGIILTSVLRGPSPRVVLGRVLPVDN